MFSFLNPFSWFSSDSSTPEIDKRWTVWDFLFWGFIVILALVVLYFIFVKASGAISKAIPKIGIGVS